ncbi:hypothetical protein [Stakelama saccharophila]|uniref:Uncharacterized protein n=1 Tax=Stakelama saccharophila TaxID=3075605 RepID=A0ABZ0B8T1_9SPHN|nr:hypothetical protein [Stakelama sp. W311]WNO52719.1 hypothetical protein RPR59_09605 [Stakelama sp. W311]
MADESDDRHEGWDVPFRKGALIGVGVPLCLLLVVLATGTWFNVTLQPGTYRQPQQFPAPGLDTGISRPTVASDVPDPAEPEDPAVTRAKRIVLRDGIPDWPEARP